MKTVMAQAMFTAEKNELLIILVQIPIRLAL